MKKCRSSHFLISEVVAKYQEDDANTKVLADFIAGNHLQFAVPKKLLKRAVDRNAVRRVARESWRAYFRQVTMPERFMSGQHQIRIRLIARPSAFPSMSRPARKRFWRVELDQLMPRVIR